ncbi:MAG: hypothetical protein PHC90_14600, partial [Syntrophorhabdaceae bacterium]|nr:hypothetical protein [Syntrophorhabdaceae bacterium]
LRIIILRTIWGTSLIIVPNCDGFFAMMVPQFFVLTQRMIHYPPQVFFEIGPVFCYNLGLDKDVKL